MTSEHLYDLVGQVFMPYNKARTTAAIAAGGRFVYYTSADTGLKILRNREMWLRNASVMNDFSEITHGMACLEHAYNGKAGQLLDSAVDGFFPGLASQIRDTFSQLRLLFHTDTYMACVSEHRAKEDLRGRLSMWRAYGGRNGVALVINGGVMFRTSNVLGAYSSPVFYGDPAAFASEFFKAAQNLADSLHLVAPLGRTMVGNAIVQMLRFAALSTKHPGFEEELEWRVIASPTIHSTPHLLRSSAVIDGVPQDVIKIRLEDKPEEGLTGLDPSELIDRIIVGPCEFPWVIHQTLSAALSELGIQNAEAKVVMSDIPLRHHR